MLRYERVLRVLTATVIALGLVSVVHHEETGVTPKAVVTWHQSSSFNDTLPRHHHAAGHGAQGAATRRSSVSRAHVRTPLQPVRTTHVYVATFAFGYGIWDRIAQCESSGNWHDTAGYYEGGLQFAPGTWTSYGGLAFAPHAYDASRTEQITVAIRVRDGWHGPHGYESAQGWEAWPVCSKKEGAQ
jgi:hypothetical protein